MATSFGQRLHEDSKDLTSFQRTLVDCSGQGTTWGPGIGPAPDGCGGGDGGGGGGASGGE